jgi:hypothetical protein
MVVNVVAVFRSVHVKGASSYIWGCKPGTSTESVVSTGWVRKRLGKGDVLGFQEVERPLACSNFSGSFDHLVVDGADGALFIQCIKDYLERSATIFI